MRHVTTTFLRGLGVVLPVALTVWILVWLAQAAETMLQPVFMLMLPEQYYLPGLGVVLGVLIIYAAGVLVQLFVINKIWEALQGLFERIPLVKTVYSAISDFFDFFSRPRSDDGSTVVSVDIGGDALLIGFITADVPSSINIPGTTGERVAVYLPLSYQIGGYMLLVARDRVTPLEIGVEEAMRMVLTAGIARD
ncbi:MAG: DUF502 domain-containing protein [Gammaproteobacteria bacterium]|nr:DUF502 domain-containing protein [Gammaproteobacteria bacterium]